MTMNRETATTETIPATDQKADAERYWRDECGATKFLSKNDSRFA